MKIPQQHFFGHLERLKGLDKSVLGYTKASLSSIISIIFLYHFPTLVSVFIIIAPNKRENGQKMWIHHAPNFSSLVTPGQPYYIYIP